MNIHKILKNLIIQIFHKITNDSFLPERKKELKRWKRANGDNTLRLDYQLNKDSIVFDVGGYKGEWSDKIYNKYNCLVHIFEPVPLFFNEMQDKFKDNKKIFIHNFGLSDNSQDGLINIEDDSSSLFKEDKEKLKIKLIDIYKFIEDNEIKSIDLIKINIEGGEYQILEKLIETNHITRIKNIQVQFHDFVPDAKNKYERLSQLLGKTHKLTYHFPFVWENWQLK